MTAAATRLFALAKDFLGTLESGRQHEIID